MTSPSETGAPGHRPRERVRLCPVCGLSMLGSRLRKESVGYDTFHCLRCGCLITTAADASTASDPRRSGVNRDA